MSDQSASRRMKLLEELKTEPGAVDLPSLARNLQVDERTIRRDVDHLQNLLAEVQGLEVRRGQVSLSRSGYPAGYFADQLGANQWEKECVAARVVHDLPDNLPVALTAGTATYYVARAIRRAVAETGHPRSLIALTNSLPALMELVAAGISTGVIGEVFSPEDCAFHASELRSTFHPEAVILGASGIVAHPQEGLLELYCSRSEEAAFMMQLIARAPTLVVVGNATKVGRRHPWMFTSPELLAGKRVQLYTTPLDSQQRATLELLAHNNSIMSLELIEVEVPTELDKGIHAA